MTLTFFRENGSEVKLGAEIGRGGEGVVYEIAGDSSFVAKIYYEKISEEKIEKLRYMSEQKNPRLQKISAWVICVLHNGKGEAAGFVMPRINAKEIHELYSLKSRRVHFPEATWDFLVHCATNVARAFYTLHDLNHVIADVNQGNCVVSRDGTVRLIDCDSFAISNGEKRYLCEVGVGTHLAPELQGRNLEDMERSKSQDNFGLAVIIFQLMFLGRHPFAGIVVSENDIPIEQCIREYRFAYGKNAYSRGVCAPPGTLMLDELPESLALKFENAFGQENTRPTAKEWIESLEDLSQNLRTCDMHPGHKFFNGLANCPWCRIEGETGMMLFPFVLGSNERKEDGGINLLTVESILQKIEHQCALRPLSLPQPAKSQKVSDVIVESNKAFRRSMNTLLVITAVVAVLISTAIGAASLTLSACAIITFGMYLMASYSSRSEGIDSSISDAEKQRLTLSNLYRLLAEESQTFPENKLVRSKIRELTQIEHPKRSELLLLTGQVAELRDSSEVEQKNSTHIEVADFAESRRSNQAALAQEFDSKSIQRKQKELGREIDSLITNARKRAFAISRKSREIEEKWEKNETEYQALLYDKSNLFLGGREFGYFVLIVLLIPITLNVFGISDVSGERQHTNTENTSEQEIFTPAESDEGSGFGSTVAQEPGDSRYDHFPSPNLTDDEFFAIPESERKEYAVGIATLVRFSNSKMPFEIGSEDMDMLLLAERFDANNPEVLQLLGENSYQAGSLAVAKDYLLRAQKIKANDYNIELVLGNVAIAYENFDEAIEIFENLRVQYPKRFEPNYNLGLTYSRVGNHRAATESFKAAIPFTENPNDAYSQLLYSLHKLRNRNEFMRYYKMLKKRNPGIAKEILAQTYKTED